MFEKKKEVIVKRYKEVISEKNRIDQCFYNGIYDRWEKPVLTRDHIPYFWKYDLNKENNPFLWNVWA